LGDQRLAPALAEDLRHLAQPSRRVEAVGRLAADQAAFERAAALRRLRHRGTRQELRGECSGEAERGGAAHEFAAVQATPHGFASQKIQFSRHETLPESGFRLPTLSGHCDPLNQAIVD
jgi:hypothetical protein